MVAINKSRVDLTLSYFVILNGREWDEVLRSDNSDGHREFGLCRHAPLS